MTVTASVVVVKNLAGVLDVTDRKTFALLLVVEHSAPLSIAALLRDLDAPPRANVDGGIAG